jgi:hypothetical protein
LKIFHRQEKLFKVLAEMKNKKKGMKQKRACKNASP